jgi:hypothetical protein
VPKATDAQGTGCYGCAITTTYGSTSYSCGSGTTYNYGSAIVAQAACHGCGYSDTSYTSPTTCNGTASNYSNGTLSTACGGKCSCTGPFSGTTTYGCTGSGSGSSCPSGGITTTFSAATVGQRCSACSQPIAGVNFFTWSTVAGTTPTYYTCTVSTCPTVTQFSCTYSTATTADTFTCKGRDTSTPETKTYSCNYQQVTNSVTTNTYYTQLRIMSTEYGSYVGVLKDQNINTNTSAFQKAYKISVTTSGNDISATAYSDLSGTVLGTASYTRGANNLAKPASGAASYAGIIKTPSAINSASVNNNAGSTYDNLSIS